MFEYSCEGNRSARGAHGRVLMSRDGRLNTRRLGVEFSHDCQQDLPGV